MKRWSVSAAVLMLATVAACSTATPPTITPAATATATALTPVPATGAGTTTAPAVTPSAAETGTVVSTPTGGSPTTGPVGERILVAELSDTSESFRASFNMLRLLDPLTGATEPLGEGEATSAVALSADGRFLATTSEGFDAVTIEIEELTTGQSQSIESSATSLAWRADGRLTYYVEYTDELWLAGTDGAGNERITDDLNGSELDAPIALPIWNSEEDYLLSGTPSWSPDGHFAVFAALLPSPLSFGARLLLFDATTKRTTPLDVGLGAEASGPAWSPTRPEIAFVASGPEGSATDIYVVGINNGTVTGTPRRVTTDPATEVAPVWSPDGTRLAYASNASGSFDVFTSDAHGDAGPEKQLATEADEIPLAWGTFGGTPAASASPTPQLPRATGQLLLASAGDDATALTLLAPDGTVVRELRLDGEAKHVRLSPDGVSIGYLLGTGNGAYDLYVMETAGDGSERRRLAMSVGNTFAWSPDSARLAFYANGLTLSVIAGDGTGTRVLAEGLTVTDDYWPPAWRADGGAIAIAASSDDAAGIYIVDTASGAATPLGPNDAVEQHPAWLPDGRVIYEELTEKQFNQTFFTEYHLVEADPSEPVAHQVVDAAGEGATKPFISPNGEYVAFVNEDDGRLRVLERATGRVVDVPGTYVEPLGVFSGWSPDGTHLAYRALDDPQSPMSPSAVFVSPATVTGRIRVSDLPGHISWYVGP